MDKIDREALTLRNRAMADAFHATPLKHLIRRGLLRSFARIPKTPLLRAKRNRVLLIRPDHLGDALLATPAIHALRATQPHLEIHVLAGPWSAPIFSVYNEIDAVLTLAFPGFNREGNASLGSPYLLARSAARKIRRIGYDAVVILRPDHWWGALVAHMARIPRVIGYNHPDVEPFLTDILPRRDEHAVWQNLRLVEHWVGPLKRDRIVFRFPVSSVDRESLADLLEGFGMDAREPYLCIHAGAGTWVKLWDEANWAAAADTLAEQLGVRIVLTGTEQERAMVQRIAAGMQHASPVLLAGETQVSQLAALFERARVVLGPDSGPLHLAAAVGAPTVSLFGPARLSEFAPWGSAHQHITLTSDLACVGCGVLDWGDDPPMYHPCVREITVGRVLEAARRAASYAEVNPG
jgi:lipopolysaccharide heptosyltransferase II